MKGRKTVKEVSIIGGADGPTSIFLVGKRKKPSLSNQIRSERNAE